MGGKSPKQPEYVTPEAPKLPTSDEIYASGVKYAKENYPLAFGAREDLLSNFTDPSKTNAYFDAFQPSSFEQALGNQYFENALPASENKIKSSLSLSGMESSPVLARLMADNTNNLNYQIGSYLSNQGYTRAAADMALRDIEPSMMVNPYADTALNQSQKQAFYNNEYNKAVAQDNYARAWEEYNAKGNKKAQIAQTVGTVIGGIVGTVMGGQTVAGMSVGGAIGGAIGNQLKGEQRQPVYSYQTGYGQRNYNDQDGRNGTNNSGSSNNYGEIMKMILDIYKNRAGNVGTTGST